MTEIDFDGLGFPHKRGQLARPEFPVDKYCRLTLLPLLYQLDDEARDKFDIQLASSYAPEVAEPSRRASSEIMRRLPMEELVEVVETLQFLTGAPSQ